MRQFGLIGFPLGHSFSKKYFTQKFIDLGIDKEASFELFEIENIESLSNILHQNPNLKGFSITIPHKISILPYLQEIDHAAQAIGAVNSVKINSNGELKGYNTDYYGFKKSVLELIGDQKPKALVLGIGGAARAVTQALQDIGIDYKLVSRSLGKDTITYEEAKSHILTHKLIVNCSPLGTFPKVEECPDIAYENLSNQHFLFDLVYNPEETTFLRKGKEKGAATRNGYDMLVFQAEKSWEIWNS
ncbi:MAG: shikimate dehydrogenase family protein [Leadbetterella sp.]